MAIRLESLGGLRVTHNGGELVELPRQRLRCALLLFLAVERTAPRERLMEVFWPTRQPDRARRTLSQMIYELRQKLGRDWVELRSDQVRATAELTTDALEFAERVELGEVGGAAAVYRGPFLGSVQLLDTPDFERWVDQQRTHFAALYRQAQTANIDNLVSGGDASGALAAARRWVLADPMDDDAQHRLIELLARSGLRNEALRQYEDYRERLTWIEAEPLDSTKELVESLKAGSLTVEVPADIKSGLDRHFEAKTGIVVFPILNLSKEESNQYFCDGLAEEIIHVLSGAPGLRVVPRTSAFTFDQPGVRVRSAVGELGVTHALEGSVRFAGDRYRIRIALIEGAGETELWEDQFDGMLATADVFDLQERIAEAVLSALADQLELGDGATAPSRPRPERAGEERREKADPEAHALYLQGRHAWLRRGIPDLERAIVLFERAISVDPSYARAFAGIADVYLVLGGVDYATRPPKELYDKAKTAAEAALELNPELAEAHAAMGNFLMNHAWLWDAAGERLRHAIELNPGYSTARQWYSNYLMCLGREDEAIAQATLALELDPRSAFLSSSLARHYQLMRQPERAVEQYRRALELDPTFLGSRVGLAWAALQSGQTDACLTRIGEMEEQVEREIPLLLAMRAYAMGLAGQAARARKTVQRLKATAAPYLPPEYVALGYLGLREHDRALDWLEKALAARSQTLTLLRMEPVFDPLRGSLRFKRLLAELDFPE